MEEGEKRAVCIICGRQPSSFYFRVDALAKRSSFFLGLFGVDVDRLFEDYPDAVGVICLSCLLAYRRRDAQ